MVHKQDSTDYFGQILKEFAVCPGVDTKKDISKENMWDFVCKERTRILKFYQIVGIFICFTCCCVID